MPSLLHPSKPTKIHLIRHGEVSLPDGERVYGDLEMPLSPRGYEQLEAVAREFASDPLEAIYASNLERAQIGARSVAKPHGRAVRILPGLREIYRGDWRGLSWSEIESRWPGGPERFVRKPATYRDHHGETLADVDRRAAIAFARIVDESSGASAAVVSHSWIIRCLLARALGAPLEAAMSVPIDTGSIQTLVGDSGGWRIACVNRRPTDRMPPRPQANGSPAG